MFNRKEFAARSSIDVRGEGRNEKGASGLLRMYTDRWQTLTGNRKIRNQRRNFEEMLMNDLPGAAEKTNIAMHAVLESELEDNEITVENEMNESRAQQKHETPLTVRNHALLHYFANLARSNNFNDKMDFSFVQSLVKNGASINTADKHGQTVFHEVARSWHTDVAKFLLNNGADLNKVDKFGRSPLHVAAAVDYVDMVEFLLENGAQVDTKTFGEMQTPMHFAAKNDAVNAMKMLLAYKSDINCIDYKNRTPLQVAAELNRAKSSSFLINESASAVVSDSQGNSVISLLIEKLPSVALKALDQFHLKDRINRKQYFYLNCLEPCEDQYHAGRAKTPLEVAVLHNHSDLLLHPVFQRLIHVKWKRFGKIRAWSALLINVFYAIFWTILCVTQAKQPSDHYNPLGEKWWRIGLEIIVFILTCYEVRKQFSEIFGSRKEHREWIIWKTTDLSRDREFCHPRWPEELRYLDQELKSLRGQRALLFKDAWNHFEWLTCTILLATVLTYLINLFYHSATAYTVHMRVSVCLLVALWLRIMKYARAFRQTGPFVIILGHIASDFLKWGFLFFIIYIPYAASFWMVFGGVNTTPVEGYGTVSELLFNVFRMTVVDQYNFEGLSRRDPNMAKLLCGSYIALSAVIILNILIALLSHTFQRVYDNAKSNAVMQKAYIILNLERSLGEKRRQKVHDYLNAYCSPEVLPYEDETVDNEVSVQATNKTIAEEVEEMFHVVSASLGKRVGRKTFSDFDAIIERVKSVRKSQQDLQEASLRIRVHLMKLENFLQVIDDLPNDSQGSTRSNTSKASQQTTKSLPRNVASETKQKPLEPATVKSDLTTVTSSPLTSPSSPVTSISPRAKQNLSLPLRRKCGVVSLQHDPDLYTTFLKSQASASIRTSQDEGKPRLNAPPLHLSHSTSALPRITVDTIPGARSSLSNSGSSRNSSLIKRRKHKRAKKLVRSSSQSSSHHSSSRLSDDERESLKSIQSKTDDDDQKNDSSEHESGMVNKGLDCDETESDVEESKLNNDSG